MLRGLESDAQLVARVRKGDVEAFNQLITRWEKRLYNYILRLVSAQPGGREDALDLCQEAFLKAYRSLASLDDPAKFPNWLYRIAHNLAYSHLRRPALMESAGERVEQEWGSGFGNLAEWDGASSTTRSSGLSSALLAEAPTRKVFGLELEFAVAKALDLLAPEQREAIVLKVHHGFQFNEIAEIMSCPVSTVKSRIYTGFAQLREHLRDRAGTRSNAVADAPRSAARR